MDTQTGIITGAVKDEGNYQVKITAENALGRTLKPHLKVWQYIGADTSYGGQHMDVFGDNIDDAKFVK